MVCSTMLPIFAQRTRVPRSWFWSSAAPGTGRERTRDAEHNLNLVSVDFDPTHEGADDLAAAMPIQAVEPGMDPLGELLQTPDDQMQATVGCFNGSDSIPFGAQMFEPLLQTGHTRPELVGADHLIGVAVNQPIDAALQTRDLSVQCAQVGI